MRHRLGVDKPIGVQYVDFLVNAVRGEWGSSLVTGKPVVEEVRKVLPYTIDLTVTAIVLGALIGVPLGVWSALRRNTWVDYVARIGSLLGLSFPAFVSAILLLLVFAIHLRWFPVISADRSTIRSSGCAASHSPPSISPSSWPPMSRG
jgi:ABC-type dipeptide/oligopeptide/nickel transport system permease component